MNTKHVVVIVKKTMKFVKSYRWLPGQKIRFEAVVFLPEARYNEHNKVFVLHRFTNVCKSRGVFLCSSEVFGWFFISLHHYSKKLGF
ncbi:hypothetical protein HanHA300_Chr07g0253971 [Helianthus annuus]|nr:hypothetical protein HanIR_Chr09g0417741 [Helianthus annuus]KAJ0551155.1 hypothetical protein HanHA300_Chr07g0253971 [Helianthus annuus]KAJ0558104.1 hypothetical protein HanIR_Chr07g0332651 [Helianthus annuus]KAJ0729454.1 hypothetical protein HanLR1_Chr07g0253101 [Helianthus annuus]